MRRYSVSFATMRSSFSLAPSVCSCSPESAMLLRTHCMLRSSFAVLPLAPTSPIHSQINQHTCSTHHYYTPELVCFTCFQQAIVLIAPSRHNGQSRPDRKSPIICAGKQALLFIIISSRGDTRHNYQHQHHHHRDEGQQLFEQLIFYRLRTG